MALGTPRRLKGRKMVTIDISKSQFMENPVEFTKRFLRKCLAIHNQNIRD